MLDGSRFQVVTSMSTADWLYANAAVCEALAEHYDFQVARRARSIDWFSVPAGYEMVAVAGDSTGSMFVECQNYEGAGGMLYVDSEGGAGVLAPSLSEWLNILVLLPYWQDVLKFSGNGELIEMRRAAREFEDALVAGDPTFAGVRSKLIATLPAYESIDAVRALHQNLCRSPEIIVRAPDGNPFGSLFGAFTIDRLLDRKARLRGLGA